MLVTDTDIAHLTLAGRDGTCDIYDVVRIEGVDSQLTFVVSTDRVNRPGVEGSAGVPGKGLANAHLAAFWFKQLARVGPHHFVALLSERDKLRDIFVLREAITRVPRDLATRTLVMYKGRPIDIDCRVYGYLTNDLRAIDAASDVIARPLLAEARPGDRLRQPLFVPIHSSAPGPARAGMEQLIGVLGPDDAALIRDYALSAYQLAHDWALERGFVIASATLRYTHQGAPLGEGAQGVRRERVILAGLPFTPETAEFWDRERHAAGTAGVDFANEPVDAWLAGRPTTGMAMASTLPPDVAEQAADRYSELFTRLTGQELPAPSA